MPQFWEKDEHSIFNPDPAFLLLTTELQRDVIKGIDRLHERYIEIAGCSTLPHGQWMNKEDFRLLAICKGLGYDKMKFSDIINQALVAGGLKIAEFQAECEKEMGITE